MEQERKRNGLHVHACHMEGEACRSLRGEEGAEGWLRMSRGHCCVRRRVLIRVHLSKSVCSKEISHLNLSDNRYFRALIP